MDTPKYEYWGLKASTWDLLHGGSSEWDDREFYRGVIQQSGVPALDVGCGTGRLLLDYLARGIDIDGVDTSPEMLDLGHAKARRAGMSPRLFQQSMQSLDLPRRYRTIIVPSSSFQLVVERDQAAEAMRRFFLHLEPGGVLAMPFTIPYRGGSKSDMVVEDWKCDADEANAEDGSLIRLWTRRVFDCVQQLEHTQNRFEVIRDGVVVAAEEHVRSPATRWYTQPDARDLYARAGFTGIRLVSGFSAAPAERDDSLFTALGVRP